MRPLPEGLYVCADCGDVRGKTPDGRLSVCSCQGVECTRCGARGRRPISDHFDPRSGWLHTPWFMAMGHACPPGTAPADGPRLRSVSTDDDLRAYQEAMTRLALARLQAWAEDRGDVTQAGTGARDDHPDA